MQGQPKIRIKLNRKAPIDDIKIAVDKLSAVNTQVGEQLIDKSTELEALCLCLITREHLLLDGLHGTGKSRLVEEMFARITGANMFSIQFMKGTQIDELFGPLDAKKYHDQAIWERNIQGFLPSADLAFLDEVYRAADMLLPSTMKILNERVYHNGLTAIKCPLGTAVGTCNFQTDNTELDAIHDRWLAHLKVQPLSTSPLRLRMLRCEYERRKKGTALRATIDLEDLRLLQNYVDQVVVTDQVRELYEELVVEYRKRVSAVYISDRRLCWALRLAQASFLMSNTAAALNNAAMPVDAIAATRFGLITVNEEKFQGPFTEAFEHVIGTFLKSQQECELLSVFETAVRRCSNLYDEKMAKKDAEDLAVNVVRLQSGLGRIPSELKPTTPKGQERLRSITDSLASLALTLVSERHIVLPTEQEEVINFDKDSADKVDF
jgi:MoxR-like ATPase